MFLLPDFLSFSRNLYRDCNIRAPSMHCSLHRVNKTSKSPRRATGKWYLWFLSIIWGGTNNWNSASHNKWNKPITVSPTSLIIIDNMYTINNNMMWSRRNDDACDCYVSQDCILLIFGYKICVITTKCFSGFSHGFLASTCYSSLFILMQLFPQSITALFFSIKSMPNTKSIFKSCTNKNCT